jgi:hypothetical protein
VDESRAIVDVPRLVTDHPGHIVSLGELDQRRGKCGLGPAGMMQLHFHGESIAEDGPPPTKCALGLMVVTVPEV